MTLLSHYFPFPWPLPHSSRLFSKGLLRSWADSSPCFHLLLFLLPSFIQNTSLSLVSQLPLLHIPPAPLPTSLLSSRRHYSSAAAVRPDLSAPCPLPFISSKFLFFIVSQCLFFTPVSVRLCACLESGQHTPLLAAHLLSPVTALVGRVKGKKNESPHVDEDASPSLVVCLITAEHMVAHRCLSGRRPGTPVPSRRHTNTHSRV